MNGVIIVEKEDKTITSTLKRNAGLDLLKILLMFMILLMHCFLFSGQLNKDLFEDGNSEIAWIIESFAIVAVNCYVLISGYFLVNSSCNRKKVFKLMIQVLTYSLIIFIIFKLGMKYSISWKDTLQSIFPITLKTYWFITSYIILYLLAPFLNIILKNTTKKEMQFLLGTITLISWLSSFLYYLKFDVIDTTKGYGILWLINLYFLAGYIRLHVHEKNNKSKYLLGYLVLSILIYATRVFILKANPNNIVLSNIFYCYNSVLVTISSVCLFMFFKEVKIKNVYIQSAITKIAPLTLAIYIIHEHPLIKRVLYNLLYAFNQIININIIITIFIFCIIIYVYCCLCELARKALIDLIKNKLSKIKKK